MSNSDSGPLKATLGTAGGHKASANNLLKPVDVTTSATAPNSTPASPSLAKHRQARKQQQQREPKAHREGSGEPNAMVSSSRREEAPVRELSDWAVRPQGGLHQAFVTVGYKDTPKREVLLGSFGTEAEAQQVCKAFATPKWNEDTTSCAVCRGGFTVLTRRRHTCRNCGRRVCTSCSDRAWPAKMVPFTYNDKNDSKVRVCNTCHFLMEEFRGALLTGDEETARAMYARGCINLRCPYVIYDNELPVHCAAKSGNIPLLQWLVELCRCPIYQDAEQKEPLTNRQGQSVLAVAAEAGKLEMVRYLILTQNANVREITGLEALWNALEMAIREGAAAGE